MPRTQCMEALLASSVPDCNLCRFPVDQQLPGAKRSRLRGRLAIVKLVGSPPRRDAGFPDAAWNAVVTLEYGLRPRVTLLRSFCWLHSQHWPQYAAGSRRVMPCHACMHALAPSPSSTTFSDVISRRSCGFRHAACRDSARCYRSATSKKGCDLDAGAPTENDFKRGC